MRNATRFLCACLHAHFGPTRESRSLSICFLVALLAGVVRLSRTTDRTSSNPFWRFQGLAIPKDLIVLFGHSLDLERISEPWKNDMLDRPIKLVSDMKTRLNVRYHVAGVLGQMGRYPTSSRSIPDSLPVVEFFERIVSFYFDIAFGGSELHVYHMNSVCGL